jgi:hypothetical protein
MDLSLAEMYGTPGAQEASEDQEKVAQAKMFAELAAENGIKLAEMNDEQLESLWDATFAKEAMPETCPKCEKAKGDCTCEKKEDKGEEKEAAAHAEFAEQQEWQEKVAEMDYLGRLMAHAYVQELGSINEGIEGEEKTAGAPESVGAHFGKNREKYQAATGGIGGAAVGGAMGGGKGALIGGALGAGAGYLGGRMGKGYARGQVKESSAIDEFAAQSALEKAAAAGFDTDEATDRINSVFTLGVIGDSEKIAMAKDTQGAVEIRSLEILEAAGYPVTWGE